MGRVYLRKGDYLEIIPGKGAYLTLSSGESHHLSLPKVDLEVIILKLRKKRVKGPDGKTRWIDDYKYWKVEHRD